MKIKIKIPTTLRSITLEKYQKYLKIQEHNTDETFLAIKMIEIFLGLRGDTIMKMKAKSIRDITLVLTEMFKDKTALVTKFTMNNKEYGFIPHLKDMTFGEYIDLDSNIGDFENIHKAMGVLYRPIKQKVKSKYLIEDYTGEEGDSMFDMPMDAVLGSIIFFYHLGIDLSKTMLNSLDQEEMNSLQLTNLEKNGDGMEHYSMNSLKEILHELKISLN